MAQYKGASSEGHHKRSWPRHAPDEEKGEKQREQVEQTKQRIAEEKKMKSSIDKKFSARIIQIQRQILWFNLKIRKAKQLSHQRSLTSTKAGRLQTEP